MTTEHERRRRMFAIKRVESESRRMLAAIESDGFEHVTPAELVEWMEAMPRRYHVLGMHHETMAWNETAGWVRVVLGALLDTRTSATEEGDGVDPAAACPVVAQAHCHSAHLG